MLEQDRFQSLARIVEAVGLLQNLDELLERALEVVVEHLGTERVIVFLWNPDQHRLEPRATRGVEASELEDAATVSQSALTQALEGGGVLHIAHGDAGPVTDASRSMARLGITSLVSAPVLLRGRPVGVIYSDSRRPLRLGPADLALVDAIAKQIGVAVENARVHDRVQGEAAAKERVYGPIVREIRDRYSVRNLIGRGPAFRQVLDLVDRLQTGRTSVLLQGENGTGKELIARTIHYQSDRRDRPFVALNCAALPEHLLESELFGIEGGVATGVKERSGRFEDADEGTLFLDEIADMAPTVQAKVLRALQERMFERVGGKKTIQVDVRVIAATSRDLEHMVRDGSFRQDLYYRLAVFPIPLPPLRDRPEDLPDLARHFLERAAAEHGRSDLVLSEAALGALANYAWPGNVRELQNVIERAVLLARGRVIGIDAFAGALQGPSTLGSVTPTLPPPRRSTPRTPPCPTRRRARRSWTGSTGPTWRVPSVSIGATSRRWPGRRGCAGSACTRSCAASVSTRRSSACRRPPEEPWVSGGSDMSGDTDAESVRLGGRIRRKSLLKNGLRFWPAARYLPREHNAQPREIPR